MERDGGDPGFWARTVLGAFAVGTVLNLLRDVYAGRSGAEVLPLLALYLLVLVLLFLVVVVAGRREAGRPAREVPDFGVRLIVVVALSTLASALLRDLARGAALTDLAPVAAGFLLVVSPLLVLLVIRARRRSRNGD